MIGLACKQKSAVWNMLRQRIHWVTASEVPSVLHCNPYCSRPKLFRQKLGREDRPHHEGAAIDHGRAGEDEAIEALVAHFGGWSSRFYQPGTVIGVDPEIRISCSPDVVECCRGGETRGWEIKTPFTRPIPDAPDKVYMEHMFQALANALVFQGRGNVLTWQLYYHDRARPDYDPRRHFEVRADSVSSELLASELERFVNALDNVDEEYGKVNRATRSWEEKRLLADILSGIHIKQFQHVDPAAAEGDDCDEDASCEAPPTPTEMHCV